MCFIGVKNNSSAATQPNCYVFAVLGIKRFETIVQAFGK